MIQVVLWLAKSTFIVVLPFAVLLRTAVLAWRDGGFAAWEAVLAGAALTLLVVTDYAVWASIKFTGRLHLRRIATWIAMPLVVFYCGFAALHLSQTNAKSDSVRRQYRSLHPVLRLAVGTLVLADPDALVTDVGRVTDDYDRLGLPPRHDSRHFLQADGYVHAVDFRTRGRSRLRNGLVRGYFRLLGFRTLRHVGTADHLHVSLPQRAISH